jgi:hypothetical protein
MRWVDDFHESGVHTLREAPVAFDRRPQAFNWRTVDRLHLQHGVWVTHGDGAYLDRLASDFQ